MIPSLKLPWKSVLSVFYLWFLIFYRFCVYSNLR